MKTNRSEVTMALSATCWTLSGFGIHLRPTVESDLAAITVALNDPVGRNMLAHWIKLPRGDAQTRRDAVGEALLGGWSMLEPFTVLDSSAKIVGVRWISSPGKGAVSCGGWLHQSSRRRGIGSKALTLVMHHAGRTRGATAVATGTRTDNDAAKANLAKTGFSPTGTIGYDYRPGAREPVEGIEMWNRDLSDLAALGPIRVSGHVPHWARPA